MWLQCGYRYAEWVSVCRVGIGVCRVGVGAARMQSLSVMRQNQIDKSVTGGPEVETEEAIEVARQVTRNRCHVTINWYRCHILSLNLISIEIRFVIDIESVSVQIRLKLNIYIYIYIYILWIQFEKWRIELMTETTTKLHLLSPK